MNIGQLVGNRYQLFECLGEGGMAVVYKARDIQRNEWVAVKFLQPQAARNPTLVRRLLREGRTMGELDSPHIVRPLHHGRHQGNHYLVFEYIQGRTLRQRMAQEGRLSPMEALRIARQVLLALDCAWKKEIVHRDLSLNNIAEVPGGLIKVMDFGIAKNYAYEPITRPGQALGTAYYVSPEQALSKRVDVRSDIYALGTILYHLLAGRPPFGGNNIPQILTQHIETEPVPLTRANSYVPEEVAQIVHRAMAKDPRRRYQRPADMIQAIDVCRTALAEAARTPQPRPAARRPNWLAVLLIAAGILLVIVLILLITGQSGGGTAGVLTSP